MSKKNVMHKKKLIYFLLGLILFQGLNLYSQNIEEDDDGKIKFSGYIQTQYQKFFVPDSIGSTRRDFAHFSGGNFVNDNTFERFMIRQGRINLSYKKDFTSSKISIDVSERGVGIKRYLYKVFHSGI